MEGDSRACNANLRAGAVGRALGAVALVSRHGLERNLQECAVRHSQLDLQPGDRSAGDRDLEVDPGDDRVVRHLVHQKFDLGFALLQHDAITGYLSHCGWLFLCLFRNGNGGVYR